MCKGATYVQYRYTGDDLHVSLLGLSALLEKREEDKGQVKCAEGGLQRNSDSSDGQDRLKAPSWDPQQQPGGGPHRSPDPQPPQIRVQLGSALLRVDAHRRCVFLPTIFSPHMKKKPSQSFSSSFFLIQPRFSCNSCSD